ncbi:MAG: nucleotidyltransferase domain-containing protein [Candidatus Falkowbacteria bacterium]|nr:nucleotidyltransferase domain-containing protein [Candidatus Falkowbacteria bacterium]
MEKKYQTDLNKLKKQIIQDYKPEKIILFGSLAWGKAHKDSDIDLFIIKKTTKRFGARIDEVNLLANKAKILSPKDILVFAPAEVKKDWN